MAKSPNQPSVAIVVPVRNAQQLLAECLGPIRRQLEAGDSLIVIDDASEDRTAETAEELGAQVLRRSEPGGPYAARNDGWRAASQSYILFTDVRCIARSGWLARIRETAADGADLIFSDVIVRGGSRLAERVAQQRQHLLVRHYAHNPYFLPYFPTANLGVRRAALEAVDGFQVMPSGGDADLCWRVQLAGFGQVAAIDEPLMEWQPRTTVLALLEQWAKYGRSNAVLRVAYADQGASLRPPLGPARALSVYGRRTGRKLLQDRNGGALVTILDGCVDLVHELAYGRKVRELQRGRAHG